MLDRFGELVHRSADEKAGRCNGSRRRRRDRVRPQVDPARATRQRHVHPIVDDDAGRRSSGDVDKLGHKVDEPRGLEVAFPDLNEIDVRVHSVASQLHEPDARRLEQLVGAGQPAPIGYQTENRTLTAHRDAPESTTRARDRRGPRTGSPRPGR